MCVFGDNVEHVAGRTVLVVDGMKTAKKGRKMQGVKSLHQESESNSESSFIMGHPKQAVSQLVRALETFFPCQLSIRLHEGVRFSNCDKRTNQDKVFHRASVSQPNCHSLSSGG